MLPSHKALSGQSTSKQHMWSTWNQWWNKHYCASRLIWLNIRKSENINIFNTYQIFLRILRKDRSCPFLQCVTILNTRYKSSMESYSHIGINTMNQDHFVLLSRRKTSRIRKIKQINQVNRARCTTAIPRVSW